MSGIATGTALMMGAGLVETDGIGSEAAESDTTANTASVETTSVYCAAQRRRQLGEGLQSDGDIVIPAGARMQ